MTDESARANAKAIAQVDETVSEVIDNEDGCGMATVKSPSKLLLPLIIVDNEDDSTETSTTESSSGASDDVESTPVFVSSIDIAGAATQPFCSYLLPGSPQRLLHL